MRTRRLIFATATLVSLVLVPTAGCDHSGDGLPHDGGLDVVQPDPEREPGQSEFLSAAGRPGEEAGDDGRAGADVAQAPADEAGWDGERTVEEGDIYRVLGDQQILNLNAYRGLQVIDFSDTTAPKIVGRYSITGAPVELYTYEERVIVLMNNWRGYHGSRFDTRLEEMTGGIVAIIDLSDPTRPALLSQSFIPGNIQRSRLVRGGGQAALYVAAGEWGRFHDPETGDEEWGQRTYVKSFDVSGPVIEDRTELELGGYVTDIQATPEALMVARGTSSWWQRGEGSTVTLVDISNPDGTMVRGDEVRVRGRVQSQFNMDLYKGVLRVVSGNRWGSGQGNWIQTYDAADFGALTLIDEETFGDPNEDLFATIFLGNKAFFVTYFQVDPFHAFEITDEGYATERTEFIVSGWNDFFRAVHGATRLIGIGMNDEVGEEMWGARAAVSLYDITDLDNPEPLVARAEVSTARWTWSEANWDHRAFSVLEDAVSVANGEGAPETGLVLLPFSGWDDDHYRSAVQIFTFSDNSLTLRGTMEHPDPVRRTFLPEPATATNFSETEMRFHDVADPDDPIKLGGVELAPDFRDVWTFGEVSARHRVPSHHWWYRGGDDDPEAAIEFFATREDPDVAVPIGTLEVPGRAGVVKAGDGLVVLTETGSVERDGATHPLVLVQTVDFSDPAAPKLRSGRELELPGYWRHGGHYYHDGWYNPWYHTVQMDFAQDVLVHREVNQQVAELGEEEYCWYPLRSRGVEEGECMEASHPDRDPDREDGECTLLHGYRSCTTDYRGQTTCRGEIVRCRYETATWERLSCEPLSEEEIELYFEPECQTYTARRHWQSWTLHRIDLSDPGEPALLAPLVTDPAHELRAADVFAGTYHIGWREPEEVDDDPRAYVRWFFREVDLRADDEAAAFGPAVNVPGRLVQREEDILFTQDQVYGANIIESTINQLELVDSRAHLIGSERFHDAWVRHIALDGDGLVFVNHQPWGAYYYGGYPHGRGYYDTVSDDERDDEEDSTSSRLSVYRVEEEGFVAAANVPVDDWADLRAATPGRAIFRAGSGVLIMNVDDPGAPFPQTYVGIRGWPRRFVPVGARLWIPSNRFGIQEIDADEGNLILSD